MARVDAKSKTAEPLNWFSQAQFGALAKRPGRSLLMMVQPHENGAWHVMALETIELVKGGAGQGAAVLDDHAHQMIGKYETPQAAFAAAQSFADAWTKDHKSTRAEKCDCDEIEGPQ